MRNLKTIRENYGKLLRAFETAGVTLNESQKADLDTFMLALESNIADKTKATVLATKKLVTEKLEKQYKITFEKLLNHLFENQELAAKIQKKVTKINESKKIAHKVNDYLNLYVESVLPKKAIIDCDKMQKLEALVESMKDLLVVNDDSVEAKKAELTESFANEKKNYETQIAKLRVKLDESMAKTQKLHSKIEKFKAIELLESKTKDLPSREARQIKQMLSESTTEEIEHKFDKALASVQNELAKAEEDRSSALESEIDKIIKDDEAVKEDDLLKGRHHNAHVDEGDEEADVDGSEEEVEESDTEEADEDDKIDESLMALWVKQSKVII